MGYPFNLRRKKMAQNNKPSDDAKAMTDEYIKGTSINDIAVKYNHSTEDVERIVTNPVTDEPVAETQATIEQSNEPKKGK
jgi:hypothetical protein